MSLLLTVITLITGFALYWVTCSLLRKVFGISDNKAHFIIGSLVILVCLIPRSYMLAALVFTSTFITPLVFWLGIKMLRNPK